VIGLEGKLKVLGVNRPDARIYAKYDFFNEGSQPLLGGNRIFLRSYTDVYRIGDPQAEMRLLEVNR
jgi:hypothetical protein